MHNWNEVLNEINSNGSNYDILRRKYLKDLNSYTKRNTIVYYSGWMQKQKVNDPAISSIVSINNEDKNGFMATLNRLDFNKGLDLILHTPGGDVAATESIIEYLKSKFEDIRVIVPQMAMSGGTVIACAADSILMGKHSSLGPIDPQINGIPAHGIIEEFKKAHEEISLDKTPNQAKTRVWSPILNKYHPALIGNCEKAIKWSTEMTRNNLKERMFADDADAEVKIDSILSSLGDHSVSLAHNKQYSSRKCKEMGLKIDDLEDDQKLQDLVLSVHHACMHTLSSTPAIKIIENHTGIAVVQAIQQNR